MRTRFLPIIFGVAVALTLFFAVAAGAQEERTDTEGVGVQTVEVHQQQVPNDQQQQQVVEVQQQQVQNDQQQAVAVQQQVGVQAQGCRDPRRVVDFDQGEGRTRFFNIDTDIFRLEYTTERINNNESARVDVQVLDEDNRDTGDGFVANNGADGDENINEGPGDFRLDINVKNAQYDITVFECRDNDSNNRRGGGGRGGGGGGGGGGNPVNITQENTTPDTTTSDLNTASPAAETTTADSAANADFANRPDSGSFRCDLFLRTVRDDTGALRAQYRDGNGNDELIVQRFEQCLSEDVLADTIPDRNLPFTGGMPLLFLAAIGLAATVAGGSVLRAVTRRGR